jgi:hypothetical protein
MNKGNKYGRGGLQIPDEQWDLIHQDYYELNKSVAEIAKRLGTTHTTLAKKMRDKGWKLRTKGRVRGKEYRNLPKDQRMITLRLDIETAAKRAELMTPDSFDAFEYESQLLGDD